MLGVWVNFFAVAVGGTLGTLLKGGVSSKTQTVITHALSLCILIIGVSGAIETSNMLIVIVSMVVGAIVGELLHIEEGLDKFGLWAQKRFTKGENGFAEGFVNATLLFGVGAMAVVGSLEAGLSNDSSTLLAKSALDFVSSVIFASSLGIGVAFAAIPLTIYQGGIALLSGILSPLLTEALVTEMSAVGSVLIIGLAINMIGASKERIGVANMLPAMLVPCLYFPIAAWLGRLF